MTLQDYLDEQGLTHKAFAERICVTTASVWRYATGNRMPRPNIMRKIVAATDGAVQPQDFYGQDAEGEAA